MPLWRKEAPAEAQRAESRSAVFRKNPVRTFKVVVFPSRFLWSEWQLPAATRATSSARFSGKAVKSSVSQHALSPKPKWNSSNYEMGFGTAVGVSVYAFREGDVWLEKIPRVQSNFND